MKSVLLCMAIIIGLLIPDIGRLATGIRGLVMFMLAQGFLTMEFRRDMFSRELFLVLLANVIIPVPVYFLVTFVGQAQAEAAFLIAAAPAAVASPVVIGLLNKRTDFVTMAVFLTNIITVLTLPVAIPLVSSSKVAGVDQGVYPILVAVIMTVVIPLAVASVIRMIGGRIYQAALWTKQFTLYIWLCAIALACSKASAFVLENDVPRDLLISIALVTAAVCIVNFGIGYLLGGKHFARESSQSLGQKNTLFSVWVGFTFFNPMAVIAPVAYIVFQNIYNALQILLFEISQKRRGQ